MCCAFVCVFGCVFVCVWMCVCVFGCVCVCQGMGPSEAEVHHQAVLEGNISTEACLSVLDVLSLFTQNFKVRTLPATSYLTYELTLSLSILRHV